MDIIAKVNFLADWAAEHSETFGQFLATARNDQAQRDTAQQVYATLVEAQAFLDDGIYALNPEPCGGGFYQFEIGGVAYRFDGSVAHPRMMRVNP